MNEDSGAPITRLLSEWKEGDRGALEKLMPAIYQELRGIARAHMVQERPDHTMQATDLLHEAYRRLVNVEIPWEDRVHFFAVAARMMRRILVDHARSRQREKRGGGWRRETLNEALVVSPESPVDLLALDDALLRLADRDERKAKAVELHYFGGLTYEETAKALGVSPVTIHRELKFAKAWLLSELSD